MCFIVAGFVSTARAQLSPGELARPHAELDSALGCMRCHQPGDDSMDARCLDCHVEIRELRTGNRGLHAREGLERCSECHPDHAGRDFALIPWEKGEPTSFDHQRAGWPLHGRHRELACRECHKAELQRPPILDLLERARPELSWLGLESGCEACHDDPHRQTLGADCTRCHGQARWAPAPGFDHASTRYPLDGKHLSAACAKCHQAEHLNLEHDAGGRLLPRYRPLDHEQCSSCHTDPHRGSLGGDCDSCHAPAGWEQVDRAKFDHQRTRYPLRGKHRAVECRACHDPWGKKPRFDSCDRCHKDAHAGSATLAGRVVDCAACHDVSGFRPSTYTAERHQSAAYPLQGRHETVRCDSCHTHEPSASPAGALGRAGVLLRPLHQRCVDCHEDAHRGQLSSRSGAGECAPCHTVQGWLPVSYSSERHAETGFELEGRHLEAKCGACHGPERPDLPALPGADVLGTARVALRLEESGCATCHRDVHEGRLSGSEGRGQDCRMCHSVDAFRPSLIDVAAHDKFTYRLDGAHRAVPCFSCHQEMQSEPASSSLLLSPPPGAPMLFQTDHDSCEACHKSPHGDQFAHRSGGDTCDTCHDLAGFRPAPRFDHSTYPLQGAHARVPCSGCHPPPGDGRPVVYSPLPRTCEGCHIRGVPGALRGES